MPGFWLVPWFSGPSQAVSQMPRYPRYFRGYFFRETGPDDGYISRKFNWLIFSTYFGKCLLILFLVSLWGERPIVVISE